MESSEISQVFTTLFTAPSEAIVNAAAQQRAIWMNWLRDIQRLLVDADDAVKDQIITRHLDLAPVWKMDAQVSAAIQMRVASISRTEGGLTLGLGVSVFQASGTFGFMSESSSESVLQARAQYAFSNAAQTTLKDYLDTLGITLTPDNLDQAITRLRDTSTPLPALEADEGE